MSELEREAATTKISTPKALYTRDAWSVMHRFAERANCTSTYWTYITHKQLNPNKHLSKSKEKQI